jgi:glycerol-3-phosphate dehydrogenase
MFKSSTKITSAYNREGCRESWSSKKVNEVKYMSAEDPELHSGDLLLHLSDLLFRRTEIALSGELTREAIVEIAVVPASTLGWGKQRVQAEIAHATGELQKRTVPRTETRLRAA